jgi:MerR family transcriptional regulator, light-induced transcriptional regulator
MAGIPVATLRVWERRYGVVGPARAASGQRLYSPLDVERLVLVKQLVDLGHAIGTVARAPLEALRSLAAARGVDAAHAEARPDALSLVIIGRGLARRLAAGTGQRALAWAGAHVAATFSDLPQALADLRAMGAGPVADRSAASPDRALPLAADVLLVQLASLQPEAAEQVLQLADGWPAASRIPRVAVVYGYAAEPVLRRLRDGGVELTRAPLAADELHALLRPRAGAAGVAAGAPAGAPAGTSLLRSPAPPRRFDDEALARFAAASSTVACECPRQVAEIVMQLSAFETYSADCTSRSPADAQLHAYLADVAGSARALFEQALERIALAEGLVLAESGR